jgi:hypothetical protein
MSVNPRTISLAELKPPQLSEGVVFCDSLLFNSGFQQVSYSILIACTEYGSRVTVVV